MSKTVLSLLSSASLAVALSSSLAVAQVSAPAVDAPSPSAADAGVALPPDAGTPEFRRAEPPGTTAPELQTTPVETPLSPIGSEGEAVAPQEQIDIAELDLEDLLDISVVTASGVAEERSEAAANVTAFTRDEILRMGWRSIGDVLQNVPGMYVVDDLVLPSVGVRGISGGLRGGSRIIKVMINGKPVNFRPELTAFLGPEFIPMEAVERIEIAKGPLSALYGANAFVAVVNVITRREFKEQNAVASLRARMVRGNPGYGYSAAVMNSGEHHDVFLAISQDHIDRSGLEASVTFPSQDPSLGRYRPFFADQTRGDISTPSSVFAYVRGGNDTLGTVVVQGGLQRLDAMGEFQLNSVLTDDSRHALINAWFNVDHERRWSDLISSRISFGFSRGEPAREDEQFLTTSRDSVFERNFSYRAFDTALSFELRPLERLLINVGADHAYEPQQVLFYTEILNAPRGDLGAGERVDLIGEDDSRRITLSNVGTFLQVTSSPLTALPDLKLTGNFRLDWPSEFAMQYSWRAAAIYRWTPDVVTKVIAGRAFQSPSATLLYAQPGFGISGNVIGSRTLESATPLKPQTIQSAEFVASAKLFNRLAVEGALYAQQIDDRIEFIQSGANFRATNRGQQQNVGVEVVAQGVFGRFNPFVSATLQQTLLEGELIETAPQLYPNAKGRVGTHIDVSEAHLNLSAQLRYAGPRGGSQSNVLLNNAEPYELPAYVEADVTLSTDPIELLGPQYGTTFLLSAQNLLNTRYNEPGFGGVDVPAIGRTVLLEIRQSL